MYLVNIKKNLRSPPEIYLTFLMTNNQKFTRDSSKTAGE